MCEGFLASANPRQHGCDRCGRVRSAHGGPGWPANDVHHLRVGRRYRIHTKVGDSVEGVCRLSSSDRVLIVNAGGQFTVWTGGMSYVDNL